MNSIDRWFESGVQEKTTSCDFEPLSPLQDFFSLFCSKWAVFVIAALAPAEMGCECEEDEEQKPTRYALRRCVLEKRLPHVSKKVLTDTLNRLEQVRLIERIEMPCRGVEYSLTHKGQRFLVPLRQLQQWSECNQKFLKEALCSIDDTKQL